MGSLLIALGLNPQKPQKLVPLRYGTTCEGLVPKITLCMEHLYPTYLIINLKSDRGSLITVLIFFTLSSTHNYASIFSKPILNAQTYFGLGRHVSTLIVQNTVDRFTALRKKLTTVSPENADDSEDSEPWVPLSYRPLPELPEMEQHGLRYIGGKLQKNFTKN